MDQEEIQQLPPVIHVPIRKKLRDAGAVLRSVWFILLFLLLGLIAFVCVEQGQDMLFSIIDDFRWGPFWFSMAALVMWAGQTGFGARLLIMFSDISFYENIPQEEGERQRKQTEIDVRVERRKKIATVLPRILFFVPFCIMSLGYIVAFITYDGKYAPGHKWDNWQMFIAIQLMIVFTATLSYFLLYQLFYERQIAKRMDDSIKRKMRTLYRTGSLKELGLVRHLLLSAVGAAGLCILIYSFLPIRWLQTVGSVHLITMSFGCWIAILYFIVYLDKRAPYLFLKYILLGIILFMSYIDQDHPVRSEQSPGYKKPDANVVEYFNNWFAQQHFDTARSVPVFFVSAEGGACRSGYWTSMVLASLEDALPGFNKHVFSYSSVSGGTLGVNAFNAICKWKEHIKDTISYTDAVKKFYHNDFLSAVTGRMVFAEAFNTFSPRMVERFDRASSIEKSWEEAFDAMGGDYNPMRAAFNEVTGDGPAVFINSTQVETGKRALLSNVNIDDVYFSDVVNLQEELNANVHYSTAILFSARFPFISPAGAVQPREKSTRRHYVDGGYFENMGNITNMEILSAVKSYAAAHKIKMTPYVLLISNDEAPKIKPILLANEIREPLTAFMNVRGGHTDLAHAQLQKFVCSEDICKNDFIQFNMGLKGKIVPMNWFISENAKRAIDSLFIKDEYTARGGRVAEILFKYNPALMPKTK